MLFTSAFGSQKQITDVLDELGPDWDWHCAVPNTVFFTSNLSAQELASAFESKLGTGSGKLFLISEISTNKQGRLSDRGWRLLNNPDNPRGA
jgi:hypothetical protein